MNVVRRLPAGMQTIRFRFTATYSLILFGVTTAVLGVVYAVVSRSIDAAPLDTITVQKVQQVGRWLVLRPDQQFQAADLQSVQRAVNHQTLQVLRDASIVALAGLLILSLLIGWWLSGRALRPVRRVTATANEISATDLSRRIALDGPHDEIHALADTIDAMLARLDDAFPVQRRLIDDASHELRHPLAVIRTTLDAVLSRDDVTPEERRHATGVTVRHRPDVRAGRGRPGFRPAPHPRSSRPTSISARSSTTSPGTAACSPTRPGCGSASKRPRRPW